MKQIVHVQKNYEEKITFGQRIADKLASGMGSWVFIIIQSLIIILWIIWNA